VNDAQTVHLLRPERLDGTEEDGETLLACFDD
jgi:hypothetical protein